MVRLPVPGGDDDNWGSILNTFLQVAHNGDGTLQQGAITTAGGYIKSGSGIPKMDLASSVQSSLSSADNAIQVGGDIGGTPANPSVTSTHLAAALPVAQGGTGSLTQNFVDLSTAQIVDGAKTFSTAPSAPGLTTTGPGVLETAQSVAASGSAYSISLAAGTIVNLTLTATCTLIFPSVTSGVAVSFTLELVQDSTGSRTVAWPIGVKWAGGVAPVLTSTAGALDIFNFYSIDSGTTWRGFLAGSDVR